MRKQKLVKVSPWVLAAACTLLTLIIGVFAVNNYRREKLLMTEALIQQGFTIVRFVTAGSMASLKSGSRNIHVAMSNWTDYVQQSIDNTAAQPGMKFLGLVNKDGKILASSDRSRIGSVVNDETLIFLKGYYQQGLDSGTYRFTHRNLKQDPVFQVVSEYYPFGYKNIVPRAIRHGFVPKVFSDNGRDIKGNLLKKWRVQLKDIDSGSYSLLVELDLSEFNKAVRRQLLQILSLSLALLLVGLGGWLSLITLQGLKGSQSRLRQISEFTDILVSSLPVGLIATDNDGNIQIFNNSAKEMTGIEDPVLGKTPDDVLPPELSSVLTKKNVLKGNVEQHEITLIDKEIRPRSLLLVALPVVDSMNVFAGNTLLIQDLSQIKDLQREVRRNERLAALGKMAAGVAHELRNPLSSIKGLAVLLKSRLRKDNQGLDTADIMVNEVERLNRSISELLDYARPQNLQRNHININSLLEKSLSLIIADLEAQNIQLHKNYEVEDGVVFGDRDKLNQVFLNLLLNALQAMKNGGILTVGLKEMEQGIMCSVEDDGCGLDEEHITRVFDPYFTTKSNGTGLGLAMSAKIIEEHGGYIEFRSQINTGTIVNVILPVQEDGS